MRFVSVPWSPSGNWAKMPKAFASALRMEVPVIRRFGGLAVTPTTGNRAGFTITHLPTGCAVPPLDGLPYEVALGVAEVLAAAFPWHLATDVFFFRSLDRAHQVALKDCISAVREMFGVE